MRISDWSSDVCSSDLAGSGSGVDSVLPPLSLSEELSPPVDPPGDPPVDPLVDPPEVVSPEFESSAGRAVCACSLARCCSAAAAAARRRCRSEEHTSELQSLMRISYAVVCLKNKNTHYNSLM